MREHFGHAFVALIVTAVVGLIAYAVGAGGVGALLTGFVLGPRNRRFGSGRTIAPASQTCAARTGTTSTGSETRCAQTDNRD